MSAFEVKGEAEKILLQLKKDFNVASSSEALERALRLAKIASANSTADGIVTIVKPGENSQETVKIR